MGKDSGTPRGLAANLGDARLEAWMMWPWATLGAWKKCREDMGRIGPEGYSP